MARNPAWGKTKITSTTTVKTGACELGGIFVSSASATPTIAIEDGASNVIAAFTPTAGWWPIPITLDTSLVVTISGTVTCTVVWTVS